MKFTINAVVFIFVLVLLIVPEAFAHKVTIFAWAEGDTVYTESKFSGGRMVKQGKVEVFDDSGELLLEGKTDDNGEYSFKAPKVADLTIVLTAGSGHKNSWKLTAGELGGADTPPTPSTTASESPVPEAAPSITGPNLTVQEIEAIVARQVEQKIQPLTRMLAAMQEKGPTLSDIFGGLGYIFGLVGVGAYVRYRREQRGK